MILRPLEKKAVSEVKAYIEEHYREHITVDLLARMNWQSDQVSFRTRRLHDAFAAIFLQTIHDYHIRIRMERAKLLLETSDLSIKAIGISVGYKADSGFSAAFRRFFGVSPSTYRNSIIVG
jgi:AraC-like DNA-binding protein